MDEYDEETINIINSVFPKNRINARYISIFENINIIESFFGLFIKNEKEEEIKCFEFIINYNNIYIYQLSKYGIIKGPQFLDNISILAQRLNQRLNQRFIL